jgi:hypothetical protein
MKNDNTTCQDTVVSLDAIEALCKLVTERSMKNMTEEEKLFRIILAELEDKVKLQEDFKFWKAKAVELAERAQRMREALLNAQATLKYHGIAPLIKIEQALGESQKG